MSDYRVTDKHLKEFATEQGFTLQGRVGSRVLVEGAFSAHGPCSTRENMAYLRGVRDVRARYVSNIAIDTRIQR